MRYGRLIELLKQVDRARVDLMTFLEQLGVALRGGIASLRRGRSLAPHVPAFTLLHVQLLKRLDAMHHSVSEARAEAVRLLVEEEGLSVTSVARLMGRPRQIVSRLYHHAAAQNGEAGEPDGARAHPTSGRGAAR